MAFRVSTTNVLKGLSFTSPTQATGFSGNAVVDDHVSILARSSASSTSHTYRFDRGASPAGVTFAAAFGVRSRTLGASNITGVHLQESADDAGWSSIDTIDLDSRGDGWLVIPSNTAQYLRFLVGFTVADTCDVGEFWLGTYTDFTRDIIGPYDWSEGYADVMNDAEDGSIWTDQLSDRTDELLFTWDALLDDEWEEIRDYHRAVAGRVKAHVVVPDTSAADVFHGHLTSARIARRKDVPVSLGVQLGFRASGHYFYG